MKTLQRNALYNENTIGNEMVKLDLTSAYTMNDYALCKRLEDGRLHIEFISYEAGTNLVTEFNEDALKELVSDTKTFGVIDAYFSYIWMNYLEDEHTEGLNLTAKEVAI